MHKLLFHKSGKNYEDENGFTEMIAKNNVDTKDEWLLGQNIKENIKDKTGKYIRTKNSAANLSVQLDIIHQKAHSKIITILFCCRIYKGDSSSVEPVA